MTNRNPDKQYDHPAEALPFVVRQMVRDIVHTGMPGKVISYEAAKKRAVVQPSLRTRYTDGTLEEKPPILNVPVCWLSAGGMLIHAPLEAGDPVWLMFSERGLTAWGYFGMSDAVAIAGFGALEVTLASTDGLSIKKEDGTTSIVIAPDGAITMTVPADKKVYIGPSSSALPSPVLWGRPPCREDPFSMPGIFRQVMAIRPLSAHGAVRYGSTARNADRAVLYVVRRFSAVIHAT